MLVAAENRRDHVLQWPESAVFAPLEAPMTSHHSLRPVVPRELTSSHSSSRWDQAGLTRFQNDGGGEPPVVGVQSEGI